MAYYELTVAHDCQGLTLQSKKSGAKGLGLGIKSGLSDTVVNSRVIYRGRSEPKAEYER